MGARLTKVRMSFAFARVNTGSLANMLPHIVPERSKSDFLEIMQQFVRQFSFGAHSRSEKRRDAFKGVVHDMARFFA